MRTAFCLTDLCSCSPQEIRLAQPGESGLNPIALGTPSDRKYASEGGPTFPDSFALLNCAASRPTRDILKLLDARATQFNAEGGRLEHRAPWAIIAAARPKKANIVNFAATATESGNSDF